MGRTVASNTFGSTTIKRSGAIIKGTKGTMIAQLSKVKDNVSISGNTNKPKDSA